MKLNRITYGLATVTLTPEDCLRLAQACEDWSKCSTERANDVAHINTLGAAFRAAAIAAQLQCWCNLAMVRQAMKDLGMSMN